MATLVVLYAHFLLASDLLGYCQCPWSSVCVMLEGSSIRANSLSGPVLWPVSVLLSGGEVQSMGSRASSFFLSQSIPSFHKPATDVGVLGLLLQWSRLIRGRSQPEVGPARIPVFLLSPGLEGWCLLEGARAALAITSLFIR